MKLLVFSVVMVIFFLGCGGGEKTSTGPLPDLKAEREKEALAKIQEWADFIQDKDYLHASFLVKDSSQFYNRIVAAQYFWTSRNMHDYYVFTCLKADARDYNVSRGYVAITGNVFYHSYSSSGYYRDSSAFAGTYDLDEGLDVFNDRQQYNKRYCE